MYAQKRCDFEIITLDFLEKIFSELNYTVTRKRTQKSGSQDGYDLVLDIVDQKFRNYTIYSECKDYKTNLNYTQALEKIPHIVSTHKNIDLLLFISPFENFSNTNENSKLEGFYNSISEDCPVEFLMPESYVKDYFSLYPEIYKKVYGAEIPSLKNETRAQLLKKFDKLIFSSKNLKRIIIDEDDRENYIGKVTVDKFHIPRNFRRYQDRGIYVFENPDYQINLDEFVDKSEVGVFILGNPGYGKSKELQNFAVELWEKRDANLRVPKLQYLKTFSTDTKIENLLPNDYKYISYLTIIFDGLDEIQNIIDFTNKLQNFISDNSEIIEKNRMRFVISCRTSIYNKYVKNLAGFEVCFLNEVNEGAAIRFLLKKYALDLRTDDRFNFWKYREVLENPFYLNILGGHFTKTGEILLNKSELIEKYVRNRLEDEENHKFKNDKNYEKSEILETSKKIAFSMEAMQKTSITKGEISAICNKTIAVFKNPFLQEELNTAELSFEHKNIQEYFVAKVLSNLSFEEIIDFIRIDSITNKIHPTWINVVSFLLNLNFSKTTFNQIVEWITKNDIQFIFEADFNRISDEIRIKSLQLLFEENCIKNTLWIDNSSEIGRFGNVEENVSYLIEKAKDINIHKRARISALNLLAYMSYSVEQTIDIKKLILLIIDDFRDNNDENINLLTDCFKLIQNSCIKEDLLFFQNIFDRLKPYDYKDVIDGIIYTIPDSLIDNNIDFFLDVLDKSIGEKVWVHPASTRSVISRKENVFDIFKKINNPNLLLKIYSFLIDRHKNHEIRESLIKDFLQHLKLIFVENTDLKEELVSIVSGAVLADKIRYFEDDMLVDLVQSCYIEREVFFRIFNLLSGNYSQKSFLAEIVKEEFFSAIKEKYNKGNLSDEFLNSFRNIISHRNVDLSIAFENSIENDTNYRFDEKINKERMKQRGDFQRNSRQREFDVLFYVSKLEEQMIEIFKFKKKTELSYTDMNKFYNIFYHNDDLREVVTVRAKDLLWEIIRKEFDQSGALSIDDLSHYLQKYELDIMIDILHALPKEDEQNINISSEQKDFIKKWCEVNSEKVKIAYSNFMFQGNLFTKEEDLTFETIFKFQKYFRFKLDEELLLNMIWLSRYTEDMNLDFLSEIIPKEKINQRIIENVNKTKDENSIYSYIKYFVEHEMDLKLLNFDIKEKIREFLLTDNDYYAKKLVELLYCNDLIFLQEIIDIKYLSPKKYFLDFILNLLLKQNKCDVVEKYLIQNYDQLLSNNIMEETNIIKNLIMANSYVGFTNLRQIIENNPDQYVTIDNNFRYETWQNYSNENSIDDLIFTLNFGLLNYNEERISRAHYSPIRISTEALLNICKNQNSEFCEDVVRKLNLIDLNKIFTKGGDLFYFNKLMKDIREIILNHKSKPYNLKNTIDLIEKNRYMFC